MNARILTESAVLPVAGCAAVLLLLVLVLHDGSWRTAPVLHGGVALGLGACMLLGLARVRAAAVTRRELGWILAVGAALILLGMGLPVSDDVNRYAVEGQQILHGRNPYAQAPVAAQDLVSPEIAAGVNHPDMTAIYPPLWMLLSTSVQGLWPGLHGYQALGALAGLTCVLLVLLLLRRTGRPLALVIAVAWNPLLPLFASGEAHLDAVMAALLLGACLASLPAEGGGRGRSWLAWSLLSAAILVKPFAAAALPAFLHAGRWRGWWLPLLLIPVAYVPFLGAGSGLTASLLSFGSWHFHGALEPLLRGAFGWFLEGPALATTVRVVLVLALAAGAWWIWHARSGLALPQLILRFATVLLLCLPTLHAWYLLLLVPLLPWSCGWALPLWTALGGMYVLHGVRIQQQGSWVETPWVTALAHLPALALLLWESRSSLTTCPLQGSRHV